MLRIGLDISIISFNQAGTGIYTRQLKEAILGLDGKIELELFSVNQQRDMSSRKTVRSRLDTLYRDLIWMHVQLPLLAKRSRVDLLHVPTGIIPIRTSCPVVLTIHDITPFRMPDFFPSWQRLYFRTLGIRSADKANRILTISENSKKDIVTQFSIPSEKITVTPLAAASEFRPLPTDKTDEIRQRYGLGRFILTVGTIEPRKNLIRLLEAFALLKKGGNSIKLIHAGPFGWLNEEVKHTITTLGLQDSVRFLGRVPLDDLVGLYNMADLFVFPSLYEGFGLPVLEAMSCGCPTITSNISSLPEVAGDAAILVDPYKIDTLAAAIDEVLNDRNLSKKMRASGLERSKLFSWQRCAQETLAVYHQVAGK
jgi:glycosyltransferase involved in cell wall biosynthesis